MPSFQINNYTVNITTSTIEVICGSKKYGAKLSSFKFRDSYWFPNVSHDLYGTIVFLLEQYLDERPDIEVFFSDIRYQYKFMEMTIRIETDLQTYERLIFNLSLVPQPVANQVPRQVNAISQVPQPVANQVHRQVPQRSSHVPQQSEQSFIIDIYTVKITPLKITVNDTDYIYEAELSSFKLQNSYEFPNASTDLYGTLVHNIRELTKSPTTDYHDSYVCIEKNPYQNNEIKLFINIRVGFQDYSTLKLVIPLKESRKQLQTQFQINGYTVSIAPEKIVATKGYDRYEAKLKSFRFKDTIEFPTVSWNLYDTLIHHLNNNFSHQTIYITQYPYAQSISLVIQLQIGYQDYNSLELNISKV